MRMGAQLGSPSIYSCIYLLPCELVRSHSSCALSLCRLPDPSGLAIRAGWVR